MSNNNWLERDPKDSPGLRRVQEAQQAADLAKAQEAQWAREAEIVAQEVEQEYLKVYEKAAKIDQVQSLLQEICDFANLTKTYPVAAADRLAAEGPTESTFRGHEFFLVNSGGLPEVVEKSRITVKAIRHAVTEVHPSGVPVLRDIEVVDLKYGFHGVIGGTWVVDNDFVQESGSWDKDVTIEQGIRLRVYPPSGLVELCHQKVNKIPKRHSGGKWGGGGGYTNIEETWKVLPNDEASLKRVLSEAFHDPICLGVGEFPRHQKIDPQPEPELQVNTGIGGLVKGFLGIK